MEMKRQIHPYQKTGAVIYTCRDEEGQDSRQVGGASLPGDGSALHRSPSV